MNANIPPAIARKCRNRPEVTLPASGDLETAPAGLRPKRLPSVLTILFAVIAGLLHAPATAAKSPEPGTPAAALRMQLDGLWNLDALHDQPLNEEQVFQARRNGYTVEGVYFDGYVGPQGADRVFCYLAWPQKPEGKIPVHLDLTAGAKDEGRALYLAQRLNCAAMVIEWRAPNAQFRSKWTIPMNAGAMYDLSSLHDAMPYRLIAGFSRAVDLALTRPFADAKRIHCGGGSMGGYYTLLLAGVDNRIARGHDSLGAGIMEGSQSRIAVGLDRLPAELRPIWRQAFDPFSHVRSTQAEMLFYLASNDFFFWLGDGLKHYHQMPTNKRLFIAPNSNHNVGSCDEDPERPAVQDWVGHANTAAYPAVDKVNFVGRTVSAQASASRGVAEAIAWWSPGGDVVWPARYWKRLAVRLSGRTLIAEIPLRYADSCGKLFFNLKDNAGVMVSSVPIEMSGAEPGREPVFEWGSGSVWDVESGLAAWRPTGPASHAGPGECNVAYAPETGLAIRQATGQKSFAILTNSCLPASGHAAAHKGLSLVVNGNGAAGLLEVVLQKNSGSAGTEREFVFKLNYSAQTREYVIPWDDFPGLVVDGLRFDGLRLNGSRSGSTPVEIKSVELMQ